MFLPMNFERTIIYNVKNKNGYLLSFLSSVLLLKFTDVSEMFAATMYMALTPEYLRRNNPEDISLLTCRPENMNSRRLK
jgi:hypothetical protein